MNFTAVIETDIFVIEVVSSIDDDGVTILEVYFGDDPLTHSQMIHFIKSYGEADLDDEIMSQYRIEQDALKADLAGEDWERGVA